MILTIRNTQLYIDITGLQVEVKGNKLIEKPVLFLIHGGPGGNHIRFKMEYVELQKYAQLVFIDQRGCGWSKKAKKSECTLENNIEDIEALRKHLGLSHISILGVSYGGMVAQGYAIRYPKRVEKLILSVTAPSFHFAEESKKYLKQNGTPEQIKMCETYLWPGKFKSAKHLLKYFKLLDPLYIYTYKKNKRKLPSSNTLPNKFSYEVLNAGFGGFMQHFNFLPTLKKITSPTLILAGENDWICRPNQSRMMAQHIKHSKLKIFKKCGHAIATDANKKYIKEIINFLKKKD